MEIATSTALNDLCRHCLTPVPQSGSAFVNSKQERFCCAGCLAIHTAITESNLLQYYDLRDRSDAVLGPAQVKKEEFRYLDEPTIQNEFVDAELPNQMKFYVGGIQCAACVWILERTPHLNSEIQSVRVDGVRKIAEVRIANGGRFSKFADLAQRFGYEVRPLKSGESSVEAELQSRREELKRITVAAVCAGNIMLLSSATYLGADPQFSRLFDALSLALVVPVLFYGARSFFLNSWAALRTKTPSLDLPIAAAFGGGFLLSVYNFSIAAGEVYFDSIAILVLLILSSRFFVNRLQEKFSHYEGDPLSLLPAYAKIEIGEAEVIRNAKEVQAGQIIKVSAGDRIPVDGEILTGKGWVNESILTGEAIPRTLMQASKAFAGTALVAGEIRLQAACPQYESRVAKIQEDSLRAALNRSQSNRRLEKWAQAFTLVVMGIGLMAFPIFYFSYGAPEAFSRVLSLLIVACPCALSFGVSLVYSKALALAARRGAILRNVDVFERISELKSIVFDKTGTLTKGTLALISQRENFKPEDETAVVAIESMVAHPVAFAVVRQFGRDLRVLPLVDDLEVLSGRGVQGRVHGHLYRIVSSAESSSSSHRLEITLDVFRDEEKINVLSFSDEIRSESKEIVDHLRGQGLEIYILSGDRKENVNFIARELALPESHTQARCTPEQKQAELSKLSCAAMIGDGVNDAAAMANAHLAVVVGGAMEKALKVADVFLTQDGIRALRELWRLQRDTRTAFARIRVFSILYNSVTAILALAGLMSPLLAAILMPLSSVSVLIISFISVKGNPWK